MFSKNTFKINNFQPNITYYIQYIYDYQAVRIYLNKVRTELPTVQKFTLFTIMLVLQRLYFYFKL